MKNYVIVSTYPKEGSKNIGDQLITNSVINAIKNIKGNDNASIECIWRADSWENVKDKIKNADAIIFACLAIRPHMTRSEYPFLNNIIKENIPIHVISSGTALPVEKDSFTISEYVDEDSKKALLELDKKMRIIYN